MHILYDFQYDDIKVNKRTKLRNGILLQIHALTSGTVYKTNCKHKHVKYMALWQRVSYDSKNRTYQSLSERAVYQPGLYICNNVHRHILSTVTNY